jgi:crotonobetainyl-CoA:carnitine CoA-transferase CaiB-like acyl-CoA transferase
MAKMAQHNGGVKGSGMASAAIRRRKENGRGRAIMAAAYQNGGVMANEKQIK